MRILPVLALTLVAHLASADDLSERAAAGRAASATPAGSKFDQSLIPLLGSIGQLCDPPGTVLPASELGVFLLVGDITQAGILTRVEVSPQTAVSGCFAAQMLKHRYSPPPRPGTYPIVVQLTVTN